MTITSKTTQRGNVIHLVSFSDLVDALLMNDNINSRYRQLEMPMRKGNPVATQHRKLERSMRMVVRGSGRCGGMRNSKNERRRCGNNPPHFDRLRW